MKASSVMEPEDAEQGGAYPIIGGPHLGKVGRLLVNFIQRLGFATAKRYASEYSKAHHVMEDVHLRGVDSQSTSFGGKNHPLPNLPSPQI